MSSAAVADGGAAPGSHPRAPQDDGAPIYNQADAERAWSELLALYRTALA